MQKLRGDPSKKNNKKAFIVDINICLLVGQPFEEFCYVIFANSSFLDSVVLLVIFVNFFEAFSYGRSQ